METFTQYLLKNHRKEYNDYKEEDLSLSISGGLALGEIERYFRINHSDIFKTYLFKNLKGRVIRYKAIVKSSYGPGGKGEIWKLHIGQKASNYRGIYRVELNYESFDIKGLCLGYSYLNTGTRVQEEIVYNIYGGDYEPAYFSLYKTVKVFVIEELIDNRYYKPVYVLPEDIVI